MASSEVSSLSNITLSESLETGPRPTEDTVSQVATTLQRIYITPQDPLPPQTSRRVYMHIQDFQGIVNSLQSRPQSRDPAVIMWSLGEQADAYLSSHGYIEECVQEVFNIYCTTQTKKDFVRELTTLGMAEAESRYLFEIIDIPVPYTQYYRSYGV